MFKLDYIFLDLDGPILEGRYRHYKCYKDIIENSGGNPISLEQYWDMKRNKIKRDVLLQMSNYQGKYEDYLSQWIDNIEKKEYLLFDELKPDAKKILENWRNFSKKIILITMRNHRENLIQQLNYLELLYYFDEVITCLPFGNSTKYEAIKEIKFDRAIFVGDTEEDSKTAKLMGIKFIGITNGLRKKEHFDADFYSDEIVNIDMEKLLSYCY